MIEHTFKNSLKVGKLGEEVFNRMVNISRILGIKDVSDNSAYQKLGIDFVHGYNKVGYDIKYDARAADTGNIAIELVSVLKRGEVEKQGWLYTSQADYFIYLFDEPNGYRFAFFTKPDLEHYANIGRSRTVKNRGYESVVSILPLKRAVPTFEFIFNLEQFENSVEEQQKFRDLLTAAYSGVK